jgi:hypothetical protein
MHLRGRGCPRYKFEKVALLKRGSKEEFVQRSKEIHGDKYDYSKVEYVNARTDVCLTCKIHSDFLVTPDNHIGKESGCPRCAGIAIGKANSERLLGTTHNYFAPSLQKRTAAFLEKSRMVHGDTFDYSKTVYRSNKHVIVVGCRKHGDFQTLPGRHARGAGCPICAIEGRRTQQEDFISRSIIIHGEKYDYSKVDYHTGTEKVVIVCPKHGAFLQSPSKHLAGKGCLACSESHGEREIAKWLDCNSIAYEREKIFSGCVNPTTGHKLKFDFFIPDKNLCVEFDGEQHSVERQSGIFRGSLEKIKQRDGIKNEFCKSSGIRLLRIPHTEINRVGEILVSYAS